MKETFDPKKITKYWKNQVPPNLKELQAKNEKFTDSYFPPNTNTLYSKDKDGKYIDEFNGPENEKQMFASNPQYKEEYEWKRATEIDPKWFVFEGQIEVDDVLQGALGNSYLLTAMSSLANYPYLLIEKFRTDVFNETGYYEMIFFIDGEWQIVFVDDYFVYSPKEKIFCFAKPNNNELWAILLEKAWCKINGGYSNTIQGIPADPFLALTGFATEKLDHKTMKIHELSERIIKASYQETLMTTISINDESLNNLETNGIRTNHPYTILDAKIKKNPKLFLLKLRTPWGHGEWNGDWSDKSDKWTPELQNYFGYEDKDDGSFWISINDYMKHFEGTYICYMQYGALIKTYYMEDKQYLKAPVVFNLQVMEKTQFSVNIIFRHWRYNREINDALRPFTIILFKYNKDHEVELITGKYTTKETTSALITNVEPGSYAIWLYCNIEGIKNDSNFRYACVFTCPGEFKTRYIGLDSDFTLIHKVIASDFQRIERKNINSAKNYFQGIHHKANLHGLQSYVLVNNSTENWLKCNTTFSAQDNMILFPPYKNKSSFQYLIAPNQFMIFIGHRTNHQNPENVKQSYIKTKIVLRKGNKEIPSLSSFDKFLPLQIKDSEESKTIRQVAYKSIQKEKLNENPSFNTCLSGDQSGSSEETLLKEYPNEMAELNKLSPLDTTTETKWSNVELDQGSYIGEIDVGKGVPHGRGIYTWKNGQKYIGYWINGKMNKSGTLYDAHSDKIYEGEFENEQYCGNGTLYKQAGEYFKGIFKDGKIKNGLYCYPNGDKWEGNFIFNRKSGVGIMEYSNGEKYLVEFVQDHFYKKYAIKVNSLDEKNKTNEKNNQKIDIDSLQNYMQNPEDGIEENNEKKHIETPEIIDELESDEILDFDDDNKKEEEEDKKEEEEEKKEEKEDKEKEDKKEEEQEIKEESVHDEEIEQNQIISNNYEELKLKEPFMFEQYMYVKNPEENNIIQLNYEGNTKYIGQIIDNLKEGTGGYFNGTYYYFGHFSSDYPSGNIRKFNKDQKILYDGEMDSEYKYGSFGTIFFPSGNIYTGELMNGKMHGQGTFIFSHGDSWVGTFENNHLHGKGKYYYMNNILTEDVIFENNKITTASNLRKEDPSTPEIQEFHKQVKSEYPGVIERLLKLPPLRKNTESQWKIVNLGQAKEEVNDEEEREIKEEEDDDDNVYVGETNDCDIPSGRGCLIDIKDINPEAKYYIGYFKEGLMHGQGTIYNDRWNVLYDGEFKNDKRNGFGKEYSGGTMYYGQFENNKPNGLGVYVFPNGSRYEGQFFDGHKHGLGWEINSDLIKKQKIEYEDAEIIARDEVIICNKPKHLALKKTKMENLSKDYPEAVKLISSLMPSYDNLILKTGIKQYIDGMYIGEMDNAGYRHGRGAMFKGTLNKMIHAGYYKYDLKEGQGTLYVDGELRYSGEFVNDKPFGKGKYFYRNNDTLKGTFNEKGEGTGLYTYADGSKWEGPIFALQLHGSGKQTDKRGKIKGIWKYNLGKVIEKKAIQSTKK